MMFWLGLLIIIATVEVALFLVGTFLSGDWLDGVGLAVLVTVVVLLAFGATCAVIFGLGLMGVV